MAELIWDALTYSAQIQQLVFESVDYGLGFA